LVAKNLAYDFSFKKQKGPGSGDWTCVGLTEKIYESSGISNPGNISALEYNPDYYALDITPDGFDNRSFINDEGDCFSKTLEFSKIEKQRDLRLPLPEIVGFNAGLEYQGERYIFLPYTQFLQNSLQNETIDINLKTFFDDEKVRGKIPKNTLLLRWSLINNPISSLKIIASATGKAISNLSSKMFGSSSEAIVLGGDSESESISLSKKEIAQNNQAHLPLIEINSAIDSDKTNPVKETKITTATKSSSGNSLIANPEVVISTTVLNDRKPEILAKNIESDINITKAPSNKINNKTATNITTSTAKLVSSIVNSKPVRNSETVPKNISPGISKIIAGTKPVPKASASKSSDSNQNTSSSFQAPQAIISKIYSTENNDFVELYNPTDYDFDLAEASFRLEKAKTAADPSLMIRIGNLSDGTYPGGTIIKAKGYYLIVRDEANDFYKSKADAIATRNEFSWTASAYIIYLGKGSISSPNDEDIMDAVGFGEATYFRGLAPAPKIEDNYILNRISEYGDNSRDFNLIVSNDPGIVWDEELVLDDSDYSTDTGNSQIDDNPLGLFIEPEPLVSAGINTLWHFSECYGQEVFSPGKFDCSVAIGDRLPKFNGSLKTQLNLNQSSLSFYYRNYPEINKEPNLTLKLTNNEGQNINLLLDVSMLQIEGLPNTAWRYYPSSLFPDDSWHNFTLVVNQELGYWSVYIDGQEAIKQNFSQTLPNNFTAVEVSGSSPFVFIDELVFWGRSLDPLEITANSSANVPFSPLNQRVPQRAPELKYFWDFNEGYELVNEGGGIKAKDEISGLELNLPESPWVWRSPENTGIVNTWGKNIAVDLPETLVSKDMSLAFWWRSELEPNEGRSIITLSGAGGERLALSPDNYRRGFFFNGNYGIFSEGYDNNFPHDTKWHHLALTFDSYLYKLNFFVDGEEKNSIPFVWVKDGEEPNHLEIRSELNSIELDDLSIWEGALRPFQVKDIYEQSRIVQ